MSFCMDFVQAIASADDIHRKIFVEDTRNTIYLAFNLMNVQTAWLYVKGDDRTKAVYFSMLPGESGMSAYYSGKYQADDQTSSIFTTQNQSMVSANQTQIDNDNDARKDNLSLADGLAAMFASTNGLISTAGSS